MPDDKDKSKKKPPEKPRDREDPSGLFPEHSAYDLGPIVIQAPEKLHSAPEEAQEKASDREHTPLPENSAYDLEPIIVPPEMKLGPTVDQLPDESHFDLPAVDNNSKLMPVDTSDPAKIEQAPKENIDRYSVFAPEPGTPQPVFAPGPFAPEPPPFAPGPPAFAPEMPQSFEPGSPFASSQPSFNNAKPPPPPGRGPKPPPAPASPLPYLWSQGQISNATTIAAQALAGSYTILGTIGQGGMAIVYKARQENTDRLVAIKTLKDTSPDVMKRFLREVEAHARLKHKNIVEAIDCVESGNLAFLVMEYIEGISLQDRLRKDGRIESAEELASILIQICNALDHAHQKKIIHRDLKSGNFLLLKDDNGGTLVKILDFGIAKIQDDSQRLTIEGKSLGSPLYMSPEQCTGASLTPSSDVYSLGVVAYEMATGRLPYQRASIVEIMTAHCDPKVRPEPLQTYRPDMPGIEQLDQVLQKALETKIENRFRNMTQFRQGIEFWIDAVRQGKTQTAVPDDIMVNKIDPDEARRNENKKSMQQLMKVRREQLGKTTTTIEREKFISETAPPKRRKKFVGQLIVLFSLFVILTLGLAALAITNMDYVNNVLASLSNTVDAIMGKKAVSPSPAQNTPPAVPPSPGTETAGTGVDDGQQQNSDEPETEAIPAEDSASTGDDNSEAAPSGEETQEPSGAETPESTTESTSAETTDPESTADTSQATTAPSSLPPASTDSTKFKAVPGKRTESPSSTSEKSTAFDTSKAATEATNPGQPAKELSTETQKAKETPAIPQPEEKSQPKTQPKAQPDAQPKAKNKDYLDGPNKTSPKDSATTGGTIENFDPE